jgi:siroheme synthase
MNKISQNSSKVYLVGAGPGDPGLMTIKGKMILEMADVVIYDALISPDVLAMINSQAERICVGKRRGSHSHSQEEITALLIQKAQERGDQSVVLHAQLSAQGFYAKAGFRPNGEQFEEAGIAHIEMKLELI